MNWRYRIPFHLVLTSIHEKYDPDDEKTKVDEVDKTRMAVVLSQAPPLRWLSNLMRKVETPYQLETLLARIFDEADRQRVWLGFPGDEVYEDRGFPPQNGK